MLLSQKKTCNRCKAFNKDNDPNRFIACGLGYTIQAMAYDPYGFTSFGVPMEPCPKPMTYSDLIYAEKWYRARELRKSMISTEEK